MGGVESDGEMRSAVLFAFNRQAALELGHAFADAFQPEVSVSDARSLRRVESVEMT